MEWYHLKDRAELKSAYNRLEQSGVTNLYYIPGEQLFGDDGEGSTDGSHSPTTSVSPARLKSLPRFWSRFWPAKTIDL